MESPGKADHVIPSGIGFCDLDRILVALSAGIGKIGLFLIAPYGNDLVQLFRKRHIAVMHDDIEDGMEVFFRLFLYSLDDLRICVADIQHSHAAYPVEEDIAVYILEHCALAPIDHNGVGVPAERIRNRGIAALQDLRGLRPRYLVCNDLRQFIS